MIIFFQTLFMLAAIYFSGMALAEHLIEPAQSDLRTYLILAVVFISLGIGLPNLLTFVGFA
jgi:hypothetical protein